MRLPIVAVVIITIVNIVAWNKNIGDESTDNLFFGIDGGATAAAEAAAAVAEAAVRATAASNIVVVVFFAIYS